MHNEDYIFTLVPFIDKTVLETNYETNRQSDENTPN